jgi:hypothetical protein
MTELATSGLLLTLGFLTALSLLLRVVAGLERSMDREPGRRRRRKVSARPGLSR